jgi:hypothetical protein
VDEGVVIPANQGSGRQGDTVNMKVKIIIGDIYGTGDEEQRQNSGQSLVERGHSIGGRDLCGTRNNRQPVQGPS